MNKIWTDSDKQYIKENASRMKDKELAEELTKRTGRIISIQAVRKQRQKLGIVKEQGRGVCALKGKKNEDPSKHYTGVLNPTQ